MFNILREVFVGALCARGAEEGEGVIVSFERGWETSVALSGLGEGQLIVFSGRQGERREVRHAGNTHGRLEFLKGWEVESLPTCRWRGQEERDVFVGNGWFRQCKTE